MKYIATPTDRAFELALNATKVKKSFRKPADRIMKVKSKADGQVATIESWEKKYVRISHPGFPTIVWNFNHKWDAQGFFETSVYALIENGYTALDGY